MALHECYVIQDIPINSEFLDALNELQKIRDIKVYHRYLNNKKITPIIRERTLHDHDPAMVLFEYMKQENIRLIDLFRTFDTDFSQALTKDELRDGFIVSAYFRWSVKYSTCGSWLKLI
ncbi:hypothetical protein DPMN_073377 [Dreissena polymorpha]|uniref:EF-hand domain-containing protein n=1 Tax=Dreissena polymorpha TaxID=45954 RepID=A0A9D4BYX6_DREPO|nr:hypothetical protein DPMN_073377 [Dreissena polymorpha]